MDIMAPVRAFNASKNGCIKTRDKKVSICQGGFLLIEISDKMLL